MREALTVIVPVYNAAAYLDECVGGIVPQLWPGCRLILVDDGSNDGSEAMCLKFASAHPDIIETVRTDNVGVSEARNIGISMATTPLLAFCDADDTYNPGALGLMADIIGQSRCDIVVGSFGRKPRHMTQDAKSYRCAAATEALVDTLYQRPGCHESAWAKVYRRSLFGDDCRFAKGRRYEDLEIVPRLYLQATTIAFTDAPVYFYRPNPVSFINTWADSRADAVFATKSILAYVTAHCPQAVAAAKSRLFSAAYNIFVLAVRPHRPGLANSCWQIIRQLRLSIISDPRTRLKNKAGATLSYLGKKTTALITRLSLKP